MGTSTLIYGFIWEYGLKTGEWQDSIYTHNQNVIASLNDERWPPLSARMFSITHSNNSDNGPDYAYDGRVIHFGGSFKDIEQEWDEWKSKFEDLLTRLFWIKATVHVQTEYSALKTHSWEVNLLEWAMPESAELSPIPRSAWLYESNGE